MLKRLLNLLRFLASVLLYAAGYFSYCTVTPATGFFMLEPSRRACTGICLEVDTFFEAEVEVDADSFAVD